MCQNVGNHGNWRDVRGRWLRRCMRFQIRNRGASIFAARSCGWMSTMLPCSKSAWLHCLNLLATTWMPTSKAPQNGVSKPLLRPEQAPRLSSDETPIGAPFRAVMFMQLRLSGIRRAEPSQGRAKNSHIDRRAGHGQDDEADESVACGWCPTTWAHESPIGGDAALVMLATVRHISRELIADVQNLSELC
jgi:hypothetical protein